jgi:hypothetical protein
MADVINMFLLSYQRKRRSFMEYWNRYFTYIQIKRCLLRKCYYIIFHVDAELTSFKKIKAEKSIII